MKPWPIQALGAGDVRVAVAICGVNFSDLYTSQGMLRELQPPLVLGTECVGEVTAVGAAVAHIKVSRPFTVLFTSVPCYFGRGNCQQLSKAHLIHVLYPLEIPDLNCDQNRMMK